MGMTFTATACECAQAHLAKAGNASQGYGRLLIFEVGRFSQGSQHVTSS